LCLLRQQTHAAVDANWASQLCRAAILVCHSPVTLALATAGLSIGMDIGSALFSYHQRLMLRQRAESVCHDARRRDTIFRPRLYQSTDQRLRYMTPCFNDWKRFCAVLREIASGENGHPLTSFEAQKRAQAVLIECAYSWRGQATANGGDRVELENQRAEQRTESHRGNGKRPTVPR